MVGEVSWGPMAQSQSPPPAVWSGKPRKLEADPSWLTRKALHPAGTPVGAITNDRPNRSVLMLGSAALLLPLSSRFGLNLAVGGAAESCGPARARQLNPTRTGHTRAGSASNAAGRSLTHDDPDRERNGLLSGVWCALQRVSQARQIGTRARRRIRARQNRSYPCPCSADLPGVRDPRPSRRRRWRRQDPIHAQRDRPAERRWRAIRRDQ